MKGIMCYWRIFCLILGLKTFRTGADPQEHFEQLVGSSTETMTYEFFDGVLDRLGTRLPNIKECFSHEKFHDVVPHGTQLSVNEFVNVSKVLTNTIATRICPTNFDSSMLLDVHTIVESLRNLSYHGEEDTTKCFGEFTLEKESNDGRSTALILYVYQGYCLLPEKDVFVSEYSRMFRNLTGNNLEGLGNFLSRLGIGERLSHDGHDHGTHDHHDHHGSSNETDSDHDHDHHGSSNETASEHDHNHHGSSNETASEHDHDHHGSSNETASEHDHDHHGSSNETDSDHNPGTTGPSMIDGNDTDSDHEEEQHDHDHDHSHTRKRRSTHESHSDEAPRCFTGSQLADIYGIEGSINDAKALEICPALIQQILSGACNATDTHATTADGYTQAMVYGYGTLSVAIISLLALLGMFLFPVVESRTYKTVIQFFIGLAIGTMASDVLIHIIPKILGVHAHGGHDDHDHGPADMTFVWQMSLICGGFYVVFLFENLLKTIKRSRQMQERQSDSTTGSHTVGTSQNPEELLDDISETKRSKESKSTDGSDEMLAAKDAICFNFTSTLITVFIGDILHNFADGVAIGVAFASHWATGISTSIAILCHELPHEFGDFAIYLRNGASKWRAIGLNFAAACCAFIGLYSGINMASDENVRKWLLCIIAGIFIYISLVQVLSLMLKEESDRPLLLFFIQNAGMFIGWMILMLIALYEDSIRVGS